MREESDEKTIAIKWCLDFRKDSIERKEHLFTFLDFWKK